MSSNEESNVTTVAGQEPGPPQGIDERVSAIVYHVDGDLARYLRTGEGAEPWTFIEDAQAVVDLLAACGPLHSQGAPIEGIADDTIPRAAWLVERLLGTALALNKVDEDRREAKREAAMEAEAAAEAERRDSPASKVATLAFMNGIDGRSQTVRADLLEELEKQAPEIATIVAEFLSDRADGDAALYVDPAHPEDLGIEDQATAAQAYGQHLVVVSDGDPENVRTWLVGDEAAEALRPLAREAA